MAGPIEETGKVATSVIESLKSQPLAIALIVINVMFLGGGGYILTDLAKRQGVASERRDVLIAEMMRKAYDCNMQQPRSRSNDEPER